MKNGWYMHVKKVQSTVPTMVYKLDIVKIFPKFSDLNRYLKYRDKFDEPLQI